jgi:hypothetical protein
MSLLEKDDFNEWHSQKTTQTVFGRLAEMKDRYKEMISSGCTLTNNAESTVQETARLVGVIYGIELCLNFKPENEETVQ